VEPVVGHARAAAREFRQLGFVVHHVGTTVSVEGPKSRWEEIFGVQFEKREKEFLRGVDGIRSTYHRAVGDGVAIPPPFTNLITEIHFQEPPEYF
jgi:hypothetical protein